MMALYKEQKRLTNRILFLFLFIMVLTPAWSQDLSRQNWYYGNSTNAIRFNRSTNTPSVVTNKAIPFGTGGSAVATDPANANLLFYTDGNKVYDGYHQLMPGTTGLTGATASNQPAAITPIPGIANRNKYFIFTNSTTYPTAGSISRLVIDMTQFGNAAFPAPARGAGEGTVTAVPGLSNRSEGMITVPHANGTDFWLITHQNGTATYNVTAITAASYTGGTFTTQPYTLGLPTSVAHFAYHKGVKKIAVAPQDPKTDAIILKFDDATGALTLDRTIFNSGVTSATNQAIYDIEWSPSGNYLYLSRYGETGITPNVFQYDYVNPTTTLTPILPLTTIFHSYGLQLAPDKSIYHLYQAISGGPFLAGQISEPDSVAANVNYVATPFGNIDFIGTQFPSFLPPDTVKMDVNFTFIGTCQNSPTTFFPEVKPGADSLHWDFGDTTSTNSWSPVHTFANAQTYNVKLTAFYKDEVDSVTLPVTIQSFALKLQLTQDTTACRSEFPPPRGSSSPKQFSVKVKVSGGTATSYTWSNGDIGDTLTPDSAGYYYVVVTDGSGCSAYAGVNVKEYGLQDQTYNKWYFGNKAGIDFNFSPPKALSESAMDAPEGCAIVCDKNGQQIFYTDGDKVYDKKHNVIATGIGGDPASSQSAIIIPVPGDETLYYIFTVEAINGTSQNEVYYSLFDLKQNSGLGALVKQKVPLFAKSTERLTANGQWLIVHEYGNNTFRAYSISANGIGDPVYSSIGSDHEFISAQEGEGYMKLGPKNDLAVALSTPGANLIELFHLNDSTGELTNYRKIDLKEPSGQVYGIEFSSGGNKLFATVKGTPSPSEVFEYSIDSVDMPHFKQKISGTSEFGALQIGPDGQIYMAINGSASLGTIAAVEDTTQLSSFTASGFNLAGGTNSNLGLPNFIQINSNALGGPSITVAGVCTNDSTTISGTQRDQIDEFNWQIRQGSTVVATSQESSFKFLFTTPGVYKVTMRLHNRCAADTTLTKDVTIFAPPLAPGAAVPLCTGSATLDANPPNAPSLTYLWSTADTTRTIVVQQQGIFTVDVTSKITGCVSHGNFISVDNRPKIDLGPDLTICEDTNTPTLDALNPGTTYQWTVNGVNSNTTQFQPVDTNNAGTFVYAVKITDPVTTCFVEDSKTYTIKPAPDFTFTVLDPVPLACGANGKISLKINAIPGEVTSYSYFLTGPFSPASQTTSAIDQNAPITIGPLTGKAGTYSATVADQISGCSLSKSQGMSDANFNIVADQQDFCDPVIFKVTTSASTPFEYQFTNSSTGQLTGPSTSSSSPFSQQLTSKGANFTIQIKDGSGCIDTKDVSVIYNPEVTITITPQVCTNPLSITANGPATYEWTGPGIIGGATSSTVLINPGLGTFDYSVKATPTGAGFCPTTQTRSIQIDNNLTVNFTQSDACQSTVTLTATPTGSYNYRWFKNDVYQSSLGGSQVPLGLSENGSTYEVDIVNTVNGCVYKSSPQVVQVIGPVTATLTSTPPCEDGKAFTLTAATNASGVTYVWSLDGTVLSGVTTATTDQTSNGKYQVDISKATCKSSAQLSITKNPIPVGLLPDRVIICNDPENKDEETNHYDLDPGAFAGYDWMKNQLSLNYTQQIYTATSEGKYVVELTNDFDCKATDNTDVLNECIPKVVAPNAFRPGSLIADNKDFHVLSFFITDDFEVFIYNRWGELVYQSNDRYFRWNGGMNGNGTLLPGGTYAYIIRYVSAFRPDLGKQEQRGGVALLR
jgi:hypothetical protein